MKNRTGLICAAAEDVELKAGQFRLIPLGVAMELPKGYEAHIVPRSSTFKNFGIIQTNHMGVVDESYCGDNDQWFFPAYGAEGYKDPCGRPDLSVSDHGASAENPF